jgi:hypothetical protein
MITEVIENCEQYIRKRDYRSYDPFDALTNKYLNLLTKKSDFLRRLAIQINSKSPVDLHWTGMKQMVHTKTLSDLLWYHAVNTQSSAEKVDYFFKWLMKSKSAKGCGWGLNFPYTSRFINADASMPNLYNTINSGIAICYATDRLNAANKALAVKAVNSIVNFLENELGYVCEQTKGWYSYYPGQKYPTYNVNALTLYFFTLGKSKGLFSHPQIGNRINALIELICSEQQPDGSWHYSRSEKGGWVDGFHTGFILESLAVAYKCGYESDKLRNALQKGWEFFQNVMFTPEGYPKYFADSDKYPIEAQNCAQAIQTLANIGKWLGWENKPLLEKVITLTMDNLYDKRGFFYHKKTQYITYKMPYLRWSVTPMMLALYYAKDFLNKSWLI